MKKRIWIKKFNLSKSEKEEAKYYPSLTPREKLSIVQKLREEELKRKNEDRKRLRRVLKIIKQK
jgi:ABC-type multidrug transport system ATPase subunit